MTLRADTDLPPPSRSVSASWAFPGWRRAPRSKPDSFGARRHRSRRMFLPFGGADALSDDLGPVNGGFLIDREPGVTALAGPVRSQIRRISCTMRPSRRRLSTRHGGLRLWAARPRRLTELPTGRRGRPLRPSHRCPRSPSHDPATAHRRAWPSPRRVGRRSPAPAAEVRHRPLRPVPEQYDGGPGRRREGGRGPAHAAGYPPRRGPTRQRQKEPSRAVAAPGPVAGRGFPPSASRPPRRPGTGVSRTPER